MASRLPCLLMETVNSTLFTLVLDGCNKIVRAEMQMWCGTSFCSDAGGGCLGSTEKECF